MLAIYHYWDSLNSIEIKERLIKTKAVGFDAVCLLRDAIPEKDAGKVYRTYTDMVRNADLKVTDGHAPFIRDWDLVDSLWLDNLDGEMTYGIYLGAIDEAVQDGVKTLIYHIYHGNAPSPNEIGLNRLKHLIDVAEKNEVTIAIENTSSVEYLSYVFDKIDSPNLAFCYDAGHNHCNEPGIDLLGMFGDRLGALHLHDNNGADDDHLIPFEGSIDWESIMTKIAKSNYTGPTTIESTISTISMTAPRDSRSTEEWLRDAYNAAKRLDDLRIASK